MKQRHGRGLTMIEPLVVIIAYNGTQPRAREACILTDPEKTRELIEAEAEEETYSSKIAVLNLGWRPTMVGTDMTCDKCSMASSNIELCDELPLGV